MANSEHLSHLKDGASAWNGFRSEIDRQMGKPDSGPRTVFRPNLREADLRNADLSGADLSHADLSHAQLAHANLSRTDLRGANLSEAKLSRADLTKAKLYDTNLARSVLFGATLNSARAIRADLTAANLCETDLRSAKLINTGLVGADLIGADLRNAKLYDSQLHRASLFSANFCGASLIGVDLAGATLSRTILGNALLKDCRGLDECIFWGPCVVDFSTLQQSLPLPRKFMRGCGLPEAYIDYLPSLLDEDPIQFHSCFISYSSKDEEFAKRLHADLQDNDVRCWFAPKDMRIGDKIRDRIDQSIQAYDKLLLVLSEASVASKWVEREVVTAYEKEESETTVLFPIRLDNVVMETKKAWAADIRRDRYIGDFTDWKNHDAYKIAFERLMRDLGSVCQ